MKDLVCPHCENELTKVLTSPFSDWAGMVLDICLNDQCIYFLRSWKILAQQTGASLGYRYCCESNGPVLVASRDTFKDCIISQEELDAEEEKEKQKQKEYDDLCKAIEQAMGFAREADYIGDDMLAEEQRQLAQWLKQLKKVKYRA